MNENLLLGDGEEEEEGRVVGPQGCDEVPEAGSRPRQRQLLGTIQSKLSFKPKRRGEFSQIKCLTRTSKKQVILLELEVIERKRLISRINMFKVHDV